MDVITIAKKMYQRIGELAKARERLNSLALLKAESISLYDRNIAVTIIRMKNGMEVELDGHKIKNPPVTVMEKIAKGIHWEVKLEMEKAEALYKAETTNMNALQAELNGYQSINKYISEM